MLTLYSCTICCYDDCNASFTQDLEMYDPTQDTPALARTSNMNADLGQVSCVHACTYSF
jgi:phospholipid-transporting ATPase